jgi:uncharacterized membrane protein YecN with MAPEG domain
MQSLPDLVICLAVVMYIWTAGNVTRARSRYKISAPATTGNQDFERVFRAQQNTLEHLVVFVPCLWLFSRYVSPVWGAGIGLVWVLARIWYALGYAAPTGSKRGPGFGLALAALAVLLVGAVIGILMRLAAS